MMVLQKVEIATEATRRRFCWQPLTTSGKDHVMLRFWRGLPLLTAVAALLLASLPTANAACCYFSAKDKDILQPAQKVFITWDDKEKVESFTVQPKFEGNADDFGMVIPTPTKPKLDEMPRDFFKELAVYSILKKREQPQSKLLPAPEVQFQRAALGVNLLKEDAKP